MPRVDPRRHNVEVDHVAYEQHPFEWRIGQPANTELVHEQHWRHFPASLDSGAQFDAAFDVGLAAGYLYSRYADRIRGQFGTSGRSVQRTEDFRATVELDFCRGARRDKQHRGDCRAFELIGEFSGWKQ
jgi:hypothetical protein